MNKKFALIGASGYIAPRHMRAIKETDNVLKVAYDPYDGIGIIDSYFPNAKFFTEFERFDRYTEKMRRENNLIDFVSVCSPNYLHDAHIRFGLRIGSDVICEKPLVLSPWNLDGLVDDENHYNKKIYNILQLRLHPSIIELKNKVEINQKKEKYDIDLAYITSRGSWYHASWKGDYDKSGGIATNIGIHFFDMLTLIFGEVKSSTVHLHDFDSAAGFLELEKANVRWFLSINEENLPDEVRKKGLRTYRALTIENKEIEFSDGFTDLHNKSYKMILEGKGFGIEESRPSIELVHNIRNSNPIGFKGNYHPISKNLKFNNTFITD